MSYMEAWQEQLQGAFTGSAHYIAGTQQVEKSIMILLRKTKVHKHTRKNPGKIIVSSFCI